MRHKFEKDILFQKFITEDKSAEVMALELNTTVSSIFYHLGKFGIRKHAINKGKYIFARVTEEQFERLYASGMTLMNMAKELGCSFGSIINYLRIRKGERRINGNDNRYLKDTLIELYVNQKKSTTEIARMLDLPKSRVRQAILQNGIKMRSRSECQQIFNDDYKYSFGNDWSLSDNALIKRARCYFTNHIYPLLKKEKCEDCGSTEHLHAHHLNSLSGIVNTIKEENPGKTDDELYELIIKDSRFLDTNNIRIVCRDCHYTKYHPYAQYSSEKTSQSETKPGDRREGSTTIESTGESLEASRVAASAAKCEGSGEGQNMI